ncbi:hypothetical protein PLICRDRAFT_45696 [Plicaturopsis crispa FD-325 SS-3]|uniref:Unplaced genomic scaffold PLICRscaffold_16, whole genome shotgun sequence n=1 Tax=Plicaturopsis crispa FD-325 SS-3 TaxID=944288 RepID=A0A0C9SY85_PLICR|nr:hypothetical protein PLICRDRAFT_45696 [Plicaturopsis crispa FD-325 SS-3]
MVEGSVYVLPQPQPPCQYPISCTVCQYLTSDRSPTADKTRINLIDVYRLWDMVTTVPEANHRTMLWRMVEPFIASKGYTMDPSALPDGDPLVVINGSVRWNHAHTLSALSRPAISNKSGRAVFIKSLNTCHPSAQEFPIWQSMCSPAAMQDRRNHTAPMRRVLWYTPDFTPHGYVSVPQDTRAFVVTKKYASMMVTINGIGVIVVPPDVCSCFDLIQQFFEGLEFMHSSGITHGDLGQHNIVLSRTSSGELRYLFIDFELSSSHPVPFDEPVRHHAFRRITNAGPEHSMVTPYDPFPNDIYAAGLFVETLLRANGYTYRKEWQKIPRMAEQVKWMREEDPRRRPTAAQVHSEICVLQQTLPQDVMRIPIRSSTEKDALVGRVPSFVDAVASLH